jgi:hypothetical protein
MKKFLSLIETHVSPPRSNSLSEHYNMTGTKQFLKIFSGKIRLVDCDSGKSVTIGSLLNQKCGKYTLFVVARFYG